MKERNMRPTASNLFRWAGLAGILGGILFIAVGLFHEPKVPSSATTTQWVIVHSMASVMCFLVLLGLTGLYVRQVNAAGWLGLASFLLFSLNWALTASFTVAEVFVLPVLATEAPPIAEGFLGTFNNSLGGTDFTALAALWKVTGLLYIAGGVLFGITTFRAGILPRWPAGLLVFASALAPVAALIPLEHQPMVAVPMGAALAWLGFALWSERREQAPNRERAARPPYPAEPSRVE